MFVKVNAAGKEMSRYLGHHRLHWSDTQLNLLPLFIGQSITEVNPPIKRWIISFVICVLLGLICVVLLSFKPLCQAGKCLSCLVHRGTILGLQYVELLDHGFYSNVEDVKKTSRLIRCAREVFQEHGEVIDHCIVVGRIVSGHTQDLREKVSIYCHSSN